jgi:hypothetical protein
MLNAQTENHTIDESWMFKTQEINNESFNLH